MQPNELKPKKLLLLGYLKPHNLFTPEQMADALESAMDAEAEYARYCMTGVITPEGHHRHAWRDKIKELRLKE